MSLTAQCAATPASSEPGAFVSVSASAEAVALIRERGGRLYVWITRGQCCGAGLNRLKTAHEPPGNVEFQRISAGADFELFMPAALGRLPCSLDVDLQRFPRRVTAFWEGCAWVI